jgi:hypothetical protein
VREADNGHLNDGDFGVDGAVELVALSAIAVVAVPAAVAAVRRRQEQRQMRRVAKLSHPACFQQIELTEPDFDALETAENRLLRARMSGDIDSGVYHRRMHRLALVATG